MAAPHVPEVRSQDFDPATMLCDHDKAQWDEVVYLCHDMLGSSELSKSFEYPELVGTQTPECYTTRAKNTILTNPPPKYVNWWTARDKIRRFLISQRFDFYGLDTREITSRDMMEHVLYKIGPQLAKAGLIKITGKTGNCSF